MRQFRYGDFASHQRPAQDRLDAYGYVISPEVHPDLRGKDGRRGRQHRDVLYRAIGPGQHPCHWCGRLVDWAKPYPANSDGLTVDHLDFDPANNELANLAPSCGSCNVKRALHRRHHRTL